ncbi:hypothetical protein Nepgr_007668 [Nepenthes gracilis]|uniref:Uncharacterized protein n=1 Tax=Nepenthes gracilis TaxID=150966 RepID=A0AAD3S7H7_NEPGR|nr:hypothetical protein Nepgr_007668 [Nepenthes gracilis]
MASTVEVPVFVDTTLGTRIAVAASPDIAAGDLKRELVRAHSFCFPEMGNVTVGGLMVKKKSFFYHLPDSMPLKHVCNGCGRAWFLHVEARLLNGSDNLCISEHLAAQATDSTPNDHRSTKVYSYYRNIKWKQTAKRRIWCFRASLRALVVSASQSRKKKGRRIKKKLWTEFKPNILEQEHLRLNGQCCVVPGIEECDRRQVFHTMADEDSNPMVETSSECLSEAASVSYIIEKYFLNLTDLNQFGSPSSSDIAPKAVQNQLEGQLHPKEATYSNMSNTETPTFISYAPQGKLPLSLPAYPDSASLRNKCDRNEVGKRVIMALNSLHLCQNKQKPVISVCRSKDIKSLGADAGSLVRNLVFEIGDDD